MQKQFKRVLCAVGVLSGQTQTRYSLSIAIATVVKISHAHVTA